MRRTNKISQCKKHRRKRRTIKGGGPRKRKPQGEESTSSKFQAVNIDDIDLQVDAPPSSLHRLIDESSAFGMIFKKENQIYKFVFFCDTYLKDGIVINGKTKTCTDDISRFITDSELQKSLFKQSTSNLFRRLPFQGLQMPLCPQVFDLTAKVVDENLLHNFFPGVNFAGIGVKQVGLIVMEYIEAEPFHENTFTLHVTINILAQLLRLYVIHEVIHTDMKFDNVLVKKGTDYPYLIDISTKPSYRANKNLMLNIINNVSDVCTIIEQIKIIVADMSTLNEDYGYIELSFYRHQLCRDIMSSNELIMEVYLKYLEYSGLKTVTQIEQEIKPMLDDFDYRCTTSIQQSPKQQGCVIA